LKLLSYQKPNEIKLGLYLKSWVVDLSLVYNFLSKKNKQKYEKGFPSDMISLIQHGLQKTRLVEKVLKQDLQKLLRKLPQAFSKLEDVKLLAPIPKMRKNIICLGLNYADHAKETNTPPPQKPIFFTKSPTSIIGPQDEIILPNSSKEIDYEVELAFIIGKKGKNISQYEAQEYIAGYTVFNDITARDLQRTHRQWFKGKSLDSFAPMGPFLVTKDEVLNPHDLKLSLKVNGEIMQRSNTSKMYFRIPTLLECLSQDMTVEPGDIVATGTPAGVGFMRKPPIFLKHGDIVEAYVEKIGIIKNRVKTQ
jgi:2-keto-4-pentenoate hydratase/2-oxohepta-3-ene-1,7-dioic acid hydratase in catechol pathway